MEVSLIADSNITKRALAQALKDLMETQPFEKVSVAEICEACKMNRKSFYYHFKDKYDLVEWIFESEFVDLVRQIDPQIDTTDRWMFLNDLCQYFYRERSFYTKVLEVTGQNAFRYYFHSYLFDLAMPILRERYRNHAPEDEIMEFCVSFTTDAVMLAIFRWLEEGAKIPPERFLQILQGVFETIRSRAKEIVREEQRS